MSSAGGYQVLKHLASGGMADVFLARHRSAMGIEKLVVLKRVLAQHLKDDEHLRMFRDEARIGALLQHSNLVQMFELGSLEGAPFISMEFLHGEDIRGIYRVLRERGQPLPLSVTVAIMSQVAAGLHYAHERRGLDGKPLQIVHRDVSPQNVVVTYEGTVKVVDFGIARAENRMNRTQRSVMKGKLAYMAPEQVMATELDRRTDVYAAGVMLYEMTTGQRPFRRDNELATMRAIVEETLPDPGRLLPGYPPELAAIVMKAMARKPEQRFQSARELQAAIDGFAAARGFSLSSLPLAQFMRELFGSRVDELQEVLSGRLDAKLLVAPGSSVTEDEADISTSVSLGGAPAPAPVAALPSFEHATLERVGDVLVVRLKGKLNERFDGAGLGRALSGHVVFDLRQVERITSYGVREWLQMVGALEARAKGLFLVHCTEAVVGQLSMIKRFLGPGHVLSFEAPYRCRQCRQTFAGLIDVTQHAQTLAQSTPPLLTCPACGGEADFDDDPRSYLAFGPRPPPALPASVDAVVAQLARPAAPVDAVEKALEGEATVVRVRAPLDSSIRWRRVLDGVEGNLRVDLTGVSRFEDTGVRQLSDALTGLAGEVARIVVDAAPRALLVSNADAVLTGWLVPTSVWLDGACARCADTRSTRVAWSSFAEAVRQGRAPIASCPKCNEALSLGDCGWARPLLPGATQIPPPAAVAPEPPPTRARWPLAVGAVLAALVVGPGLHFATRAAQPTAVAPTPVPTVLAAQRPAWAGAPGTREENGSLVIVTRARSVSDAELEAWIALGEAIAPRAAELERAFTSLSREAASPSAVERLKRDIAVEPDRFSAPDEEWIRLVVSSTLVAQQRSRGEQIITSRGARLARAPWPNAGLFVLTVTSGGAAMRAGLRPGDLLMERDGVALTSLDGLPTTETSFKVLAGGVMRTIKW